MSITTLNRLIAFCLVLRLISRAQCIDKELLETENIEDDTYDYIDYDYTGNDSVSYESSKPLTTIIKSDPPYFDHAKTHVSTYQGMDVVLNCDVHNFHVNNVVVWYKNQTVYSHGKYTANQRIETLKNNSIVIKNAQPDDTGDYYCEVFPENIRLYVTLEVNKMLTILCDGRDVTDRTIIYHQGESHFCECKTKGSGETNIKWSVNGSWFDETMGESMRESLIFNDIEDYHSGTYQCLDDDGSEKPRYGIFNVVVFFPPKVTTHRHHINVEIGGSAELYCDYKANPVSTVTWLKNNQPIKYSQKYMITYITEKQFNRSMLIIQDVSMDDLGEFICRAENLVGSNELRTHLMLEPERGQLQNIVIDGKKVTLHWLVRSLQPLSEAILDYKMSGTYTWSSTTVIHTQRHENGTWKITHEMELIEGEWQTRMKTKNIVGWSKFSTPFIFTIYDEGTKNNETNKENIAMAGFGITRNSSTSVSDSYVQSIVILLLSIQICCTF